MLNSRDTMIAEARRQRGGQNPPKWLPAPARVRAAVTAHIRHQAGRAIRSGSPGSENYDDIRLDASAGKESAVVLQPHFVTARRPARFPGRFTHLVTIVCLAGDHDHRLCLGNIS
jgi:hypothetical protein